MFAQSQKLPAVRPRQREKAQAKASKRRCAWWSTMMVLCSRRVDQIINGQSDKWYGISMSLPSETITLSAF